MFKNAIDICLLNDFLLYLVSLSACSDCILFYSIFIAFILEAFILEYTIQKVGKLESYVEQKIRDLGLGIGQ